jgi:hypothetical protein
MSLKLILMMLSKTTPKLGRTRGMSELKQCGCAEMTCTVEKQEEEGFPASLVAIDELFPTTI